MKVLMEIGNLQIHFFGLMIAVGILAGTFVVYFHAREKNICEELVLSTAVYGVLAAIIGARLGYILFYRPDFYLQNPLQTIMIHSGGLSVHGGIAGAVIFAVWYTKRNDLNFWKLSDVFAPGIILGQAIGRIGCDVFGKAMENSWFWGVMRNGELVHPVQIYEAMLNFIVFMLLWQKRKTINYPGQLFIWYLILFSLNRGFVELFRSNPTVFGMMSISHLLSMLFIIGALTLVFVRKDESRVSKVNGYKEKREYQNVVLESTIVLVVMVMSVLIYYSVWW